MYSSKWKAGWTTSAFSYYRWGNKDDGIVIYIGGRIEFQNRFEIWQPQ